MAKAGRPKKVATPEVAPTETKVTVKDGYYIPITQKTSYFNYDKGILFRYKSENGEDVVFIPEDSIPTGEFQDGEKGLLSVLNTASGSVVKHETKNFVRLNYTAQLVTL
jgi:hypothetical protein